MTLLPSFGPAFVSTSVLFFLSELSRLSFGEMTTALPCSPGLCPAMPCSLLPGLPVSFFVRINCFGTDCGADLWLFNVSLKDGRH